VKVKLYMDEDTMDRALVQALRMRGVDLTTTQDAGMIGSSDERQLTYAASQGRVLYSFNVVDFCALHTSFLAQGRSHAGIVLAQQNKFSIGEQMRRLLNLCTVRSAEEMVDQLEFLSAWT
jgi:hypothetical protein